MSDELRWFCKGCETYVAEDKVVTISFCIEDRSFTTRHHVAHCVRGSEMPGVYGAHMSTEECGPIDIVEVGNQERMVEWLENTR